MDSKERRKWLQEAKLQPVEKAVFYYTENDLEKRKTKANKKRLKNQEFPIVVHKLQENVKDFNRKMQHDIADLVRSSNQDKNTQSV